MPPTALLKLKLAETLNAHQDTARRVLRNRTTRNFSSNAFRFRMLLQAARSPSQRR